MFTRVSKPEHKVEQKTGLPNILEMCLKIIKRM